MKQFKFTFNNINDLKIVNITPFNFKPNDISYINIPFTLNLPRQSKLKYMDYNDVFNHSQR